MSKLSVAIMMSFAMGAFLMAGRVCAERITFTNQVDFLDALAARGYRSVHEGFEDDDAWGSVRTSIVGGQHTRPSITNWGVVWMANNENGGVTTGSGPTRTGQYGFFTLPHGDFLNGINDGWVVTNEEPIYGVAGWIKGTYGGEVDFVLDDDSANPISFGNYAFISSLHKFFGMIDTAGFHRWEVREKEASGDQAIYLFADDFYFGFDPVPTATITAVTCSNEALRLLVTGLTATAAYGVEATTDPATGLWVRVDAFKPATAAYTWEIPTTNGPTAQHFRLINP